MNIIIEYKLTCITMSTTIRNHTLLLILFFVQQLYISFFAQKYSNISKYARGQIVNGSRVFINGSVVSTENQPASSRSS